jgi:hypothetical protein
MRLTHEQVKQGILHSEQLVRDAALRYFADSFSPDASIMPLAIEAVEKYGPGKAFRCISALDGLVQTEDTLLWLIDQLNRLGRPQNYEDGQRCRQFSDVIIDADVSLLMKYEERILALEGLEPKARDMMADCLRLLTLDTASCWRELEEFCEANKGKQYINEVDLPQARRVAEAISRDQGSQERVLSLVAQKVGDSQGDAMWWMEGLAIYIAGLMRLEAAVPMIAGKLKDEDQGDLVCDECAIALARMGTDHTVGAICKEFPSANYTYRLFVAASMEKIHSDLAVQECHRLLEGEKDEDVRRNLLGALLGSFALEGIAPARQEVNRGIDDLKEDLVAAATLMEVYFPELEAWTKEVKRQNERIELSVIQPAVKAALAPALPSTFSPVSPIVSKPKVGRNDPCPCGSGKKYKKCCG